MTWRAYGKPKPIKIEMKTKNWVCLRKREEFNQLQFVWLLKSSEIVVFLFWFFICFLTRRRSVQHWHRRENSLGIGMLLVLCVCVCVIVVVVVVRVYIGGRKDRESVVVGTTHFLLLLFYSTFYFYFLLSKWGETMVVPPLTRLFLTSSSRSQRRWSLFNGEEWMNFYSICPFFFLYLSINSFEMRFFFFFKDEVFSFYGWDPFRPDSRPKKWLHFIF